MALACASAIIQVRFLNRLDAKTRTKSLPAHLALGRPHTIDKSKARAIWHEHFAH